MSKTIDLNKTVAELVKEYPEIKGIMKELGFSEIVNPMALKVMGRVMTIPKGAMVKGIDLDEIRRKFHENGFVFTDEEDKVSEEADDRESKEKSPSVTEEADTEKNDTTKTPASTGYDNSTPEGREELLKSYIRRLSDGEDLEKVRSEFVRNFDTVSVHEIAGAEQKLINEGMPVKEVQKLCDIHSALFHGKTEAEVWMQEEADQKNGNKSISEEDENKSAVKDNESGSLKKSDEALNLQTEQRARAAKQSGIDASYIQSLDEGHPVRQLMAENKVLAKILHDLEKNIAEVQKEEAGGQQTGEEKVSLIKGELFSLMKLKQLYGRKEELFMPRLDHYGTTGPTKVMWGVDDEIRSEIRILAKRVRTDNIAEISDRIKAVVIRAEEMIYKEENILYPLALENFTEKEWLEIYRDLPEMGEAFVKNPAKWDKGEAFVKEEQEKSRKKNALSGGKIHLNGGELNVSQLEAIFKKLPVDITFIDENDINRFFASENHIFARPKSALGREVYSCHPQAILPIVQQMIADFKAHKRDSVERWIPKPGNPTRVQYFAVYDENDSYIGAVEIAQAFGDVMEHIDSMRKVDGIKE